VRLLRELTLHQPAIVAESGLALGRPEVAGISVARPVPAAPAMVGLRVEARIGQRRIQPYARRRLGQQRREVFIVRTAAGGGSGGQDQMRGGMHRQRELGRRLMAAARRRLRPPGGLFPALFGACLRRFSKCRLRWWVSNMVESSAARRRFRRGPPLFLRFCIARRAAATDRSSMDSTTRLDQPVKRAAERAMIGHLLSRCRRTTRAVSSSATSPR